MEAALIGVTVLFLGSNVFWLFTVNRLLNKLMSRNYGEYVAAQNQGKERLHKVKIEGDPIVEEWEKQRATELNQMMGMV